MATMATALLLAGGQGTRLSQDCPKQFLLFGDEMLFMRSLRTFYFHSQVSKVFVVCPLEYIEVVMEKIKLANIKAEVIAGGKTRRESSYLGLCAIKTSGVNDNEIVLIHDCARPFVTADIITQNILSAQLNGACTTAVKASDSFVLSKDSISIKSALKREELYAVQTPQTFRLSLILNAREDNEATDDASVLVKQGVNVAIVLGNENNFKITTMTDFLFAKSLIESLID